MIEYESGGLLGGLGVLTQLSGSVFPRVLPYGLWASALTILIHFTAREYFSLETLAHPYAHQVFAISVGFLLVFRSNLSYQRFWEGLSNVQQMSTKWDDACLQLVAFEEAENEPDGQRFKFCAIHLFCLLHASAIQHLRDDFDLNHLVENTPDRVLPKGWFAQTHEHADKSTRSYLEVIGGISPSEKLALENVEERAYTIMAWIVRVMTRRHKFSAGLKVPPPILSRTFHVLSEGMSSYMQARKVRDTPFPFPYAQLVMTVLIIFVSTAPCVVVAYVEDMGMAVALAFLSSCAGAALNEVAKEIEDPFGFDPNDLPLGRLHAQFVLRISSLRATDLQILEAESFFDEIIPPTKEELDRKVTYFGNDGDLFDVNCTRGGHGHSDLTLAAASPPEDHSDWGPGFTPAV
mmetsp:Transcript_2320/g.5445  ORF Transcript_2320/g.5445 Transcript_2320/m.5445 type:complete len:406 (+) Transcript_2320:23-1240(+)